MSSSKISLKDDLTDILTNRSRYLEFLNIEHLGLQAGALLGEAFFYKCGYRGQLNGKPVTKLRSQCVNENMRRLDDEAYMCGTELRVFLKLGFVGQPEETLRLEVPVEAAESLFVSNMANSLQTLFKMWRKPYLENVCEKVFKWLCGKNWEQAIAESDLRMIRREGVSAKKSLSVGINRENPVQAFNLPTRIFK